MILRDEIYSNAIREYIQYFRDNKLKFNMLVQVLEGSEISKLPVEAYYNGFLHCSFDFGATETYLTDNLTIENNTLNCILVYGGVDGWEEYPVSFQLMQVIGITKIEESSRTITFNVTKEDKEFQIKVENSKSRLKLATQYNPLNKESE